MRASSFFLGLLGLSLVVFAGRANAVPVGITINGTALQSSTTGGSAWTFDGTNVTFTGAGPYVLSGTNIVGTTTNLVAFHAAADCAVTFSNLLVDTSCYDSRDIDYLFDCNDHAVTLRLWNTAGVTNILRAPPCIAGIAVTTNSNPGGLGGSLTVTNLNAAGALDVRGGTSAAGIGGQYRDPDCGTVVICGGAIHAKGGDDGGTGIGSGHGVTYASFGGSISIQGGVVVAEGGADGDGLGGGVYDSSVGAKIVVTGGKLVAIGHNYGVGINCGRYGSGGSLMMSGGTVIATRGEFLKADSANCDVGFKDSQPTVGRTTVTGGNLILSTSDNSIAPDPSNGTARVWCVTFTNLSARALSDLRDFLGGFSYGTNGLEAVDGKVCAWLPDGGPYRISLDGSFYRFQVDHGHTTVVPSSSGFVTVNDSTVNVGSGGSGDRAWTYDGEYLVLPGKGPYVLSGSNINGATTNRVSVRASNDCEIVAWDLTLDLSDLDKGASSGAYPAIDCNGYDVTLSLKSSGNVTNVLKGGCSTAGILVASNRNGVASLLVTNLNDIAALSVVAGTSSAGIGGGLFASRGGTVTIAGGAVTAVGGDFSAGIGGCGSGAFAVRITGGAVTARGGTLAAGIGQGRNGSGGTVTIAGGAVTAEGGYQSAGIGGGDGGTNVSVTISGGTVRAEGDSAPGIGLGAGGGLGTVTIAGGTVNATGGRYSPGIGAKEGLVSIAISGGDVTAQGDAFAGLGGGTNATVTIAGGTVAATGGSLSSGLVGGTVTITGGTVIATRGSGIGTQQDFGPSPDSGWSVTQTVTGGNFVLASGLVSPAPTNHLRRAWCATFNGISSAARLADLNKGLAGYGYGTNGLVAVDGKVCAWLTNGVYTVVVDGAPYQAFVADGNTLAVNLNDSPLTVNGLPVSQGSGGSGDTAWTTQEYLPVTNVNLNGKGPYVLNGSNLGGATTNVVQFVVQADCTVILSNLTVDVSSESGQVAFNCNTNAVMMLLAGTAMLKSGDRRAGIRVGPNASLVISNQSSYVSLTAQGGSGGAGIGGNAYSYGEGCGAITIAGGTVLATGGDGGAGIGGGYGAGGTITISGGFVWATGGAKGAGLGGGYYGAGGAVTLSGGTVWATGGDYGAGIGGGEVGAGGAVTLSGGLVVAGGGAYGAGIGGGQNATGGTCRVSGGTVTATRGSSAPFDIGAGDGRIASGANTFTGGNIVIKNDTVTNAPANAASAPVFCVAFTNMDDTAFVAILKGLAGYGYGTNGVNTALTGGMLCAWLTNGTYTITVGTTNWTAVVAGGKVYAVAAAVEAPKISAVSVSGTTLTLVVDTTAAVTVMRASTLNGTFTAATPTSNTVSGGKRTLTFALGGMSTGFFKVE